MCLCLEKVIYHFYSCKNAQSTDFSGFVPQKVPVLVKCVIESQFIECFMLRLVNLHYNMAKKCLNWFLHV